MNDPISQLEQELMELTPSAPSRDFINKIEEGLGSQANIAGLNDQNATGVLSFPSIPWSIAAAILLLLGVVSASFYYQQFSSEQIAKTKVNTNQPSTPDVLPASSPDDTWQATDRETVLVDVRNEGIILSPQNPPSQQFRYKYMDTTTYTDPNDHSEMQFAVPREQVVQVKLEPY